MPKPATRRAMRRRGGAGAGPGGGRGAEPRRASCSGVRTRWRRASATRRPGCGWHHRCGARGREPVRRRDRRGRRAGRRGRGADGRQVRTAEAIAAMEEPPDPFKAQPGNTTLACVMTDAALDKAGCARVARAAAAGIARAVEPVFTRRGRRCGVLSGVRRGRGADRFTVLQAQTLAARVVAEAIRDARRCRPLGRGRSRACPVRSRRRPWCCARSATARRIVCCTSTPLRGGESARSRRASRKPRSRFGGRLEPFFRLDLIMHEGRGDLATVTGAHTVAA